MAKLKNFSSSSLKTKKILFIGDIIGEVGRSIVKKLLPKLKEKYQIDFVIANGEHLSKRVGVEVDILREMQRAGVDFFTTGNHAWRNDKFKEEITKKNMPIIRPANFIAKYPGHGYRIIASPIGRVLIINLLGKEGIRERVSNPFRKLNEILASQKDFDVAILDFHAEMTSEKVAMGYHADGRLTAVFGTHTHVPTADTQILPQGTAFVSDVGMTGPKESILGVKKEIILQRFLDGKGEKFEVAQGKAVFNSVILTLDNSFRVLSVKRLDK